MPQLFKAQTNMRGLSLIELLITVVIVSFLSLAVFSTFAQGLKLWKRALSATPDIDSDFIFEKIALDLRNAYQSQMGSFVGEKDSLQFFAYGPVSYSAANGEDGIQPIRKIHYKFDQEAKKLVKNEEMMQALLAPKREAADLAYRELLRGVKECRFDYYYPGEKTGTYLWKSFWRGDCLPKAIRISLKYDDEHIVGNQIKIVSLPAQKCAA